ncbi:cyclase family protein [Aquirufa echingensis]|uniref:Cyclase family protein n=1 Tax=Aquirufa echingensis TaxID=3096516 RepID=A0ABW6D0B7_9BACT
MQPVYLSHFIDSATPIYGGASGEINIEQIRSIDKGDTSNNLLLKFPAHIGTHIDFPYHFSNDGKKCNDYPPSFWIFDKIGFLNCTIDLVEANLDVLPSDIEILILKTGYGAYRNDEIYWSSQPVIPSRFATIFKNKFSKLRIFGFDLISLTSKLDREEGKLAHINFLINNDILVLEDMNLENVNKIPKTVIVSPLQINAADGVPCNVIAF